MIDRNEFIMNWKRPKLSIFSILLSILISGFGIQHVNAEESRGYVVNQAYLQIRRGPGNEYEILKSLPNGSEVIIVNPDIGGGYAEVKLKNGITGYAMLRYLADKPVIQTIIPTVQTSNKKSISKKSIKAGTKSQTEALINERNQLADELEILRHSVTNALDIERQRNDLQERLVNLERNNRHLKLENQALQDKSSHDWFLLGAGVLFVGIFIGWLLSILGRRKSSSSWDNF